MDDTLLIREPMAVLDEDRRALFMPLEISPATERDPRPGLLRWIGRGIASACDWVFGAGMLVVALAVLAAVPVVQLLSFGYLLEAGGRVARTGRLRDGGIGLRPAARLGSVALGCLVLWFPLWLLASLAESAQIIDPQGTIARRWEIVLT